MAGVGEILSEIGESREKAIKKFAEVQQEQSSDLEEMKEEMTKRGDSMDMALRKIQVQKSR